MSLPIRYSPSGPPIANLEGGFAEPGNGYPLRMDEATTTVDPANAGLTLVATDYELKYDPSTAIAPFLRPSLATPSPVKRYRATGCVDMEATQGTAVVTAKLWVSYDAAATWAVIGTCGYNIPAGQVKHCRIDMPLVLGSLMLDPVVAGVPSMTIKLTMQSDVVDVEFNAPSGDGGTGFLQLTEML